MTTAKAIEYRIIRRSLQSGAGVAETEPGDYSSSVRWADRLIAVLATTVGLFLLGAFMEELLWAALAAATVFVLGMERG